MRKAFIRKLLIFLVVMMGQSVLAGTDRFILLPNNDGTTGAVIITTSKGTKLIKKAYTIVKVDELGNFVIIKSNALCVDKEFDDALGIIPKPNVYVINFAAGDPQLDSDAQVIMNNIMAQINATPVPFVILSGDAKLVAYLQKLLLDAKVPGLIILLDVVAASTDPNTTQQARVTVQ